MACARAGVRPHGRVATAEFAHVPLPLGRVPVFVERPVRSAHAVGVRLVVWTVDEPPQMHRLLDAGVDAVITDRPDLLGETLIARGSWSRMPGTGSRAPPRTGPLAG